MSKKLLSMLVAVAFASAFSTAQACPHEKDGCKCGEKANVKVASDKAPCHGDMKKVADKASAPCSKSKGAPCSKGAAKLVSDDANPHVDEVMATMPKITYKVGDESTCCPNAAAELAKKSHGKIVYLVADKAYDTEGDAKVALTAALEQKIADMESMQFAVGSDCVRCPITAKSLAKKSGTKVLYRVAGTDFAAKDKAEKALQLVAEAAEGVAMKYKVGEKSFCCDKMAGAEAKSSGKPMTYVVGNEETSCPTTAKLMLTKAKVHAIIAAAAAAAALAS